MKPSSPLSSAVVASTPSEAALLPEPGPARRWLRRIMGHHSMAMGVVTCLVNFNSVVHLANA